MESRIRVAVDFENGNSPVIHIAKKLSEDVRDDLIGAFINGFPSWNNRWAKIVYVGEDLSQSTLHYHIVPISIKDIEDEMKLMAAYLKERKAVPVGTPA
jgi:hypothetical protein